MADRSSEPSLQEQARALGDPTRYEIFRYIVEASEPVDVAEMTAYFQLNHNAIRQHLAKLVDAELVVEEQSASVGRGRPPLRYRVDPGVDSRWGVSGPYERLSLLLAEMVRTGDSPEEVGRRAGRALVDGDDPLEALVGAMDRQGFDPEVRGRGTRLDIVLQTCPFATTALADPDTVCALHLGMAQGAAEHTNGRLIIDDLVRHDPRRANCRLRVQVASGTHRKR